jgi:hypothetical protein
VPCCHLLLSKQYCTDQLRKVVFAGRTHNTCAGADDLTPVLILATIKAAPAALPSNLAYIERYRAASRLVSEAQYFFVQMVRHRESIHFCLMVLHSSSYWCK